MKNSKKILLLMMCLLCVCMLTACTVKHRRQRNSVCGGIAGEHEDVDRSGDRTGCRETEYYRARA